MDKPVSVVCSTCLDRDAQIVRLTDERDALEAKVSRQAEVITKLEMSRMALRGKLALPPRTPCDVHDVTIVRLRKTCESQGILLAQKDAEK